MVEIVVQSVEVMEEAHVPRGTARTTPHGLLLISLPGDTPFAALPIPMEHLPEGTKAGDSLTVVKGAVVSS